MMLSLSLVCLFFSHQLESIMCQVREGPGRSERGRAREGVVRERLHLYVCVCACVFGVAAGANNSLPQPWD
jgi:hypothetical protein